ncbi:MAG: hypothetical protein C0402_05225 [Thermodesulfovibrio sp.]|nr:hypothetical protein [Thermodesulfovibrio sp.]
MTAFSRIQKILIKVKDDPQATKLIEGVFSAALRYVTEVYTQSTTLALKRTTSDATEIGPLATRLDQNRTIAHNALIDSIKICNRYLFTKFGPEVIPVGGIYSSDPTHFTSNAYRSHIGDWAGSLVEEVFSNRVR